MSTRCIATLSANCLAPCVKRPVVTKTPRLVWAQPLGKTVVGMLAFSRCHLGVLWTRLCGDIPGLSGGKTSVMNLLAVDPGLVFSAYGVEILVSRLALVSVLRCRAGTHGLLGRLRVCSRLELGTGLLLPGLLGYRLSAALARDAAALAATTLMSSTVAPASELTDAANLSSWATAAR